MNYPQTLDYLYAHLPMFTRVGDAAIKKGLDNTLELCQLLGNPEKKFRSVHIGGTNGKGSTSHMLAAILQKAGYRTGLYTSPHLKDFRERIRINGKMISRRDIVQFVETQKQNIGKIQPSFFEVTVAMAFEHFARNQVDVAVIEVGLGGRLDSTNVITPLLSVITNIGYDHMNLLGNTLPEIAFEKAGIIKPGIPVVIGEKQAEVENIFREKAKQCKSELHFASEEWVVESQKAGKAGTGEFLNLKVKPIPPSLFPLLELQSDLRGSYQIKNILTVLSSAEQLHKLGLKITGRHIGRALKNVQKLTGLSGRWQTLGINPLVICDTGHNEDGIREVLNNIKATPHEQLHIVIGMLKDKDTHKILDLLPKDARYYFCSPRLQRAKPAAELSGEAQAFSLRGKAYPSVRDALQAAKNAANARDLIFIGGSTFVVAEVV